MGLHCGLTERACGACGCRRGTRCCGVRSSRTGSTIQTTSRGQSQMVWVRHPGRPHPLPLPLRALSGGCSRVQTAPRGAHPAQQRQLSTPRVTPRGVMYEIHHLFHLSPPRSMCVCVYGDEDARATKTRDIEVNCCELASNEAVGEATSSSGGPGTLQTEVYALGLFPLPRMASAVPCKAILLLAPGSLRL